MCIPQCVTNIIDVLFVDARMEALLADLNLLNDDIINAIGSYSSLDEIRTACETFQTKTLNENTLALSQAERLRKHNNYMSKLKTCTKLYKNLNEKLTKGLKVTKR